MALSPSAVCAQEQGSRQTREFVEAAGQADRFEIMEAQTVLGQSTDAQVRAFAQQMISAHEEMSKSLRDATARAGLKPPPMGLSGDQALLLGALQSQRGPELDKTYARHQVLAHRSALTVEQAYAATGDDAVIRQTATTATPAISSHLAMAEQMNARLSGS
jgi:putative membrane protein